MLDLVLTNQEGFLGSVKLKGSLDCSDHKMVEFKIFRASKRVRSRLATLDLRRANIDLFRELLSRVTWEKALEGRGSYESWLVFKDHVLQTQKQRNPRETKAGKNARRPLWINKELPD